MLSYRPEIDGLRAIAIAAVVAFHAGGSVFSGGYVGVDIFFVISGFLITSLIVKAEAEGGFSYRDFYARRARRILPALLVMTAVVTVTAFAIFLPADLIDYGKMLIYTLLFGANVRLTATPAYFDTASQDNPLLHMWSLAVEEQFYLLWPTLLVALLAFFTQKRLRLAVLLLALASLVCSEILVRDLPKSAFYHLPSRGWELLAGAILAMGVVPAIKSKALAEALAVLGAILMLGPVFLYDKETAFPGLAALPPVLGCVLVIHSETAFRTRVGNLLSLKPIVFVGLISYSLYLWHWPVFAFPSYVLMREATLTESAGLAAIAVLLATLSWRFIEKPFRKKSDPARAAITRRRVSQHIPFSRAAYAATALTACLIASGSYFQQSRGAEWRLPAEVVALSRMSVDAPYLSCARIEQLLNGLIACDIGKGLVPDERPKIVLWGDSHAMHYEKLVAAAIGEGVAYLHDGCPPIPGVYLVTKTIEPQDVVCLKNKDAVLAKILEVKPNLVILAGRWTFSEPFPYGLNVHPTRYFVRAPSDPRELSHSRRVFAEELTGTVRQLTSSGIHVLLMGQVPEMLIPVAHCLAVSHYFDGDESRCLSISRTEVDRRQVNVNRVLRSIEAGDPLVKVFWPIPSMCDGVVCYGVRDGKLLYRDTDHLTPAGALSLVDVFRQSFPADFLGSDRRELTSARGAIAK